MKKVLMNLFILVLFLSNLLLAQNTYQIDVVHSKIGFGVKHMVIATVEGNFKKFNGTIQFDGENVQSLQVEVTVDVNSINTDNEQRDNHLRSPDFFDVAKFPTATFKSKKVVERDGKFILVGDLTLKGVTKEIEIPFTYNGKIIDPWNNERIGFEGETKINRKDFGLNWNKTLQNNSLLVGNEVTIKLHVEAVKMKKK